MLALSILPERCCMLFQRGRLAHDVIASNICSDGEREGERGRGNITEAILFWWRILSGLQGGVHR